MSEASQTGARKPSVVEGRRELQDILRTTRAMEEKRLNPFLMDIGEALELADRFFPAWQHIEDLTLDARAMNALSRVVQMQEGRLRYQAQLFHADPEAVQEKLGKLSKERLGKLFLECWHPVVELEQLTAQALEDAMKYWAQLEPVEERHRLRPRREPPQPEELNLDDLLARGVLKREGFAGVVLGMWEELQKRGSVEYWDFIRAPSHAERVRRAYATSYLITYGYGWLSEGEGKLVLNPRGERQPPERSVSMPIVIPARTAKS